jgi:tryptophan 7-halogenase
MPIDRIIIASSGVAGWLTASALARRFPAGLVSITVIESVGVDDSLGIPTFAEPSLQSTPLYHAELGYDEDALMAAARGSFTLGRSLSSWTRGTTPAFHPYSDIGGPIGALGFHHLVARLRGAGEMINIGNYSVAALCAQSNRFARPPPDPRSVLSTMDYGIHIPVKPYGDWMKSDALAHGVESYTGRVSDVTLDNAGLITEITVDTGQRISGDLFIDCTGPAADLLTRIPGAVFEDWSIWLPCDRARSALHQTGQSPKPFTELVAHGAGWQRFVTLPGSEDETSLYCSAIQHGENSDYRFVSGKQAKAWAGNCVAIGGAAALIDPVASTPLHLTQSAILRLLALFPHDRNGRAEQLEFARQTDEELACARDYAVLHYAANGRAGDAFWDLCRTTQMPKTLAYRLALYKSCGRVALHDGEVFEASDWIALFDALGVFPARYDALADAVPIAEIQAHFARLRAVMLKAVATVPPHAETLTRLVPMEINA